MLLPNISHLFGEVYLINPHIKFISVIHTSSSVIQHGIKTCRGTRRLPPITPSCTPLNCSKTYITHSLLQFDLRAPREHSYSAQNLRVVLQNLVPNAQVFTIGLQIHEATAREAKRVWEEYINECDVKNTLVWKEGSVWVGLTPTRSYGLAEGHLITLDAKYQRQEL